MSYEILMPLSLCCRAQHLCHTRRELLPAMSGCESHVCLVLRRGKEQISDFISSLDLAAFV